MKDLLLKTPLFLLYSRLLAALLILVLSYTGLRPLFIVALCMYAMLSDLLFDVLSRRLKILIPEWRQLGMRINTLFWFSCLFYLCVNQPGFLRTHAAQVLLLVFLELFIILFGLLKFRERLSFQTLLSKFWVLLMMWFFSEAVFSGPAISMSFTMAFWYGIVVQLEILAMAFILKSNESRMSGIIHALKFRRGNPL